MDVGLIDREDVVLVVVDVQEKFRGKVFEFDRVVKNTRKLVEGFKLLNLPIIVSEQYPDGLGTTVDELKESLSDFTPVVKVSFDCLGEVAFVRELEKHDRKTIILAGIESHVCVLQTALHALSKHFKVHVALDAVSSIREIDYEIAIERFKQAGVYLASSEMVLFQLLKDSKEKEFKQLSAISKKYA